MSSPRTLKYGLAINEAFHQVMEKDPSVILIGQGTKSPWYVGNTAQGLLERFGPNRVIDTPVSENAITGAAVGAALAGMKPVVVHPRVDFMLYAFDPIVNQSANWFYMNGGKNPVPVVFWGIINRGGEQAAQHSQALHATFAHIPGLKVVMPATPYDAKGLMVAAVMDPNPVVFIDDRWQYELEDVVPEEYYSVPIGKANVRVVGNDVTLVALSTLVEESNIAVTELKKEGISVELIDIRSIKPLDIQTIISSVEKTGRLVIADPGWHTYGVSAEIAAVVGEKTFNKLKSPIIRVALPDCPAPAATVLEKVYYIESEAIIQAVRKVFAE